MLYGGLRNATAPDLKSFIPTRKPVPAHVGARDTRDLFAQYWFQTSLPALGPRGRSGKMHEAPCRDFHYESVDDAVHCTMMWGDASLCTAPYFDPSLASRAGRVARTEMVPTKSPTHSLSVVRPQPMTAQGASTPGAPPEQNLGNFKTAQEAQECHTLTPSRIMLCSRG